MRLRASRHPAPALWDRPRGRHATCHLKLKTCAWLLYTARRVTTVIARCIKELQIRFVMKMTNFMVKVVTKDGIKIIKQSDLPKV